MICLPGGTVEFLQCNLCEGNGISRSMVWVEGACSKSAEKAADTPINAFGRVPELSDVSGKCDCSVGNIFLHAGWQARRSTQGTYKDTMARASLRFWARVFMTVGRTATFMPRAEMATDWDLSAGSMTKVPVK